MKESKQVHEWKKPWPYWNQRQNSHWEPGFHFTCLEFFRGIQEYCKAPVRFPHKKSSKAMCIPLLTDLPIRNLPTFIVNLGLGFHRFPLSFPEAGLWNRMLSVCDNYFQGFVGCSWNLCFGKQTFFGCFLTFSFVQEIRATHLDKMENDSLTKLE